jgi:choline dehydrogenase
MSDAFDYVIVGAGSAGCVLADRLSESGEHQVCVLEAGGKDDKTNIKTPMLLQFTITDPKINWNYWTQRLKKA